jgi:hypothetical protein
VVEGSVPVEGFVGALCVELLAEGFDVFCEVLAVGDLVAVEPLVFQALVEAFDDAVGLGCVVAGADVAQLGFADECLLSRFRKSGSGRRLT